MTVGNTCEVENTPYTAYSLSGEFINIVSRYGAQSFVCPSAFLTEISRGNCRVGLYCDSATKQCRQNKALGEECTADKE